MRFPPDPQYLIAKKVSISLLTFLLFVANGTFAGVSADSTEQERITVFKALPLGYYTPETRIALEAFAFVSWYTKGSKHSSNARLFAVYTQNKQYSITIPWQIFTPNERFFHNGRVDFRQFPEYFYGLGNNTSEDGREMYEFQSFGFENKGYVKTSSNLRLGLLSKSQKLTPMVADTSMLFAENGILGASYGYSFAGLGPSLLWDTRDHTLSPTTGRYFELTSLFALAEVDMAATSFSMISLDARTYKRIGDNTTWANQLVVQASFGDVPFRELPSLGGPYLHRGYYQGRFRDKNLFLLQTELRRDISNRFGLAAFVSAGRVGATFMDKLIANIHPAVGGGVRFKIDKDDQTTIRLDYSITPDSSGFYLFFAEAF